METHAHRTLKRMALAFLRSQGCSAVATEVGCPICRYRADAAGYADVDPLEQRRCEPRVIVIECKQSREDFLRDRRQVDRLLRLRDHLHRVRASIEEHRIKVEEPQLRHAGSSLFAEMDDWDFTASRLPSYRAVNRRLRRIDEQLYGQTKFFLMTQYRLADRMYIAAPRGMIRPGELPSGWGLLECPRDWLEPVPGRSRHDESPELAVRIDATEQHTQPARRLRWLRNIAVAASWSAYPHTRGVITEPAFQVPAAPPSLQRVLG